MKVYLLVAGEKRCECTLAFDVADYVTVVTEDGCPQCKSKPLRVHGNGPRPSEDDRAYEADATSVCCGKVVGVLRAEVNMLFGVREDQAVLNGRCRVY